ncbi:hypothetical protein SISNIDRAFT_486807 [Sistotremastrum niveocremeum HHB9708]|uniref:Uncharacterized protein n=1 Tax=Sistotremastrum niveocremeum HHB9708 TaxID=1314777 RepID=A0A164TDB6_9AGAM|nr:hypothetical protein SISNIDRAFT_486807 [Sistotremastrum niveocremeum HHB9708]
MSGSDSFLNIDQTFTPTTSTISTKEWVITNRQPLRIAIGVFSLLHSCQVILPCLMIPLLRLLGIGRSGVIKGGLAAKSQSHKPQEQIKAGSAFAKSQSIAMGGTLMRVPSVDELLVALSVLVFGLVLIIWSDV